MKDGQHAARAGKDVTVVTYGRMVQLCGKAASELAAEGIDVRCTGGYAVMPPSPHASGVTYEWVTDTTLDDAASYRLSEVTATADQHGMDLAPWALADGLTLSGRALRCVGVQLPATAPDVARVIEVRRLDT